MKQLRRLTAILSFFAMFQYAGASNLIYVDQIGSGSTIDFTQTGSGNQIGNATNRATITGNNNNITVEQIGSNNIQALSVTGSGNNITNTITGDNNDITTTVNGSTANVTATVTGDGNQVTQDIDGPSTSTVNISTDNNTVGITNNSTNALGAFSSVSITTGGGNIVSISQTGAAGTLGHSATLSIDGATNNVDIKQGGIVDSTVNASIVGSGNTLNINSNF